MIIKNELDKIKTFFHQKIKTFFHPMTTEQKRENDRDKHWKILLKKIDAYQKKINNLKQQLPIAKLKNDNNYEYNKLSDEIAKETFKQDEIVEKINNLETYIIEQKTNISQRYNLLLFMCFFVLFW